MSTIYDNIMGFISDTLEKHGFTVQKGYGGLETSFRADLCGNGERPKDRWPGMIHSFFVVQKQSKCSKMSDSIRKMNESYSQKIFDIREV